MQSQQIRRQFLKYFKDNKHTVVPSSPVVPHDDPTLLFINAGMNQFKDVFLGKSHRDYTRAASSQKCIRVGGKHNDLENVGHTRRHLTFFEMLGNFSFGDYFKAEAIKFAWEVSTQVFGFDEKRIWPSVFREDDEAFELWTKYVPADRITRMDEKDNFWAMGDTGPCGPCSELYYDQDPSKSFKNPKEDENGERFLEFWNLVFMQNNLQADGKMLVLPKPSIDTGAGLERVVSLAMNVDTIFATDVLRGLIAQTENLLHVKYDPTDQKTAPAFHVIADHLRCLAFAIADGAQPSNVDRGYVLRKVLRRAVRYGRTLGFNEPFLAKILPRLVDSMGPDYPEIVKAQHLIAEIVTGEEEAFIRTLKRGGNILNQVIDSSKQQGNKISGDDAFKLKDTYGLPIDEITLLAKDANLSVDLDRYKTLEEEAKTRSRNVHKTVHQVASENQFADFVKQNGATEFLGYSQLSAEGKVIAIVVEGAFTQELPEGLEGLVILDKSPFYAEMGGQIGDLGSFHNKNSQFTVTDTQAPYKGLIAHQGLLSTGVLKVGDIVTASVNTERRQLIANNHSATHLLHWALHQLLGEHVKQAGSVVDQERLRFDFNHHKALTKEEIQAIEDLVNAKIRDNVPVKWYEIDYEDAQKCPEIKQFFGEKYSNRVRVVDIDYSKELCGGTHTSSLGTIGLFRIAKESSIAAGVRRIEAVTGKHAEALSREHETLIEYVAGLLKSQPAKLKERVEKLLEEHKHMINEIKAAKKKEVQELIARLSEDVTTIKNFKAVVTEVNLPPEELKLLAEDLFAKIQPSAVVILGAKAGEDKCHLIARVSDDLVGQGIQANKIIQAIAPLVEGTGGGKPNSAQAGGKNPAKLAEALAKAIELLNR